MINQDQPQAISGTRKGIKQLAEGTLRLTIDLDNQWTLGDIHRLFPEIDTPVAIAPLEANFEYKTYPQTQDTAPDPAQDKPFGGGGGGGDGAKFGHYAKELYKSGFFYNQKVLEAVGTDDDYQEWCREQPCAKTGDTYNVVYAHVRRADNGGVGMKPKYWGIPLRQDWHDKQHQQGEVSTFGSKDWMTNQRNKHISRWMAQNVFWGQDSMRHVNPLDVLSWAAKIGQLSALPQCYRDFKHD